MATLTQKDRRLELTTPLGKDVLLVRSVRGTERISSLFQYEIEAFSENRTNVDFSKLIGQSMSVTIALDNGGTRYLNGIVVRAARGGRGTDYTAYRFDIVPRLWLLTRVRQSRIFQQLAVPDILKTVLEGLDVAWELQGRFEPRDYCVQYRETDFAFASRLMEEEGIFYFFKTAADGHKLIIANTPQSHSETPHLSELQYSEISGAAEVTECIYSWEKVQSLRSGAVTLWDHCFELPHKHLESTETIQQTVNVGKTTHKLNLTNDRLELYDYPGGYAQRFDGIAPGGGDRADDLQKIFADNKRTASIRMQQEALGSLVIEGHSDYAGLIPGHKFTLARHFSDDGAYIAVETEMEVSQGGSYIGGESPDDVFRSDVRFRCFPLGLPCRPAQLTPRPVIHGTQTAVVVGPAGEEIFTDKYGRIKVQFHWDRDGKNNADSSCWIRVATLWAAKNFGTVFIPRVGTEVVVAFQEGDPDQPIVVGSVYNAECMPPYLLPENKTMSGFKTRSSPQAGSQNLNEIRFQDEKGNEHIYIHGEKDFELRVKNDYKANIGHDFHETVAGDVKAEYSTNRDIKIGVSQSTEIGSDFSLKIGGKSAADVGASHSLKIGANSLLQAGAAIHQKAGTSLKLEAATGVEISCSAGITLKCGGNSITLNPGGIFIKGSLVHINSASAAISASTVNAINPIAPKAPLVSREPGTTGLPKNRAGEGGRPVSGGAAAAAAGSSAAAVSAVDSSQVHKAQSSENREKTSFVEAQLVDESGAPVANEAVRVQLPDGTIAEGTTDDQGRFRVANTDPGTATISFPNLDQDALQEK